MKNRLKLDWALSTSVERNAFLSKYLSEEPFLSSPPNEDELETLANYVLWGKNEERKGSSDRYLERKALRSTDVESAQSSFKRFLDIYLSSICT